MKIKLFVLVSVLLISGCSIPMVASLEKRPGYIRTTDPNKGVVYFYREGDYAGSMRGMYIDVDGKRVGALNSGTYFVYETAPGEINVSIEDKLSKKQPTRNVKVEAGKAYYVKGSIKFGFWDAVPAINLVMPEEGEGAIKELIYATMKEKDLK